MSKRILFFILFSWLASAAFPAFAQQKTDTVYTFRFVPRKDMFYVPWNDNGKELVLHFVFVAGIGSFSCFCAAENRHGLHFPLRAAKRHVLCAME